MENIELVGIRLGYEGHLASGSLSTANADHADAILDLDRGAERLGEILNEL
jgi:hypothetical protein